MMYDNGYGGYDGFMGHGYAVGAHWIAWPFEVVGATIALTVGLLWLAFVIWALLDVKKHKPAHSTAWIFVIIFGHMMGPIGYYFIVARDHKMINKGQVVQ